jgi:hypothetical protein
MRTDPLRVLARLRWIEEQDARRRLAHRAAQLQEAVAHHAGIAAALDREAASGAPADYGAWLPRARAALERAALQYEAAGTALDAARADLAARRAAAKAVARVQEGRGALEAKRQARAQQAALDAVALRGASKA